MAGHPDFVGKLLTDEKLVATGFGARFNVTTVEGAAHLSNALSHTTTFPFAQLILAVAVVGCCDTGEMNGSEPYASQVAGGGYSSMYTHAYELRRFQEQTSLSVDFIGSTGIEFNISTPEQKDHNYDLNLSNAIVPGEAADTNGLTDKHVMVSVNDIPVYNLDTAVAVVQSLTAFGGGANRLVGTFPATTSSYESLSDAGDDDKRDFTESYLLQVAPLTFNVFNPGVAIEKFLFKVESLDGVQLDDFKGEQGREGCGIQVVHVEDDSDAYKAGIRTGFELLSVRALGINKGYEDLYVSENLSRRPNGDVAFTAPASVVKATEPGHFVFVFKSNLPLLNIKFNVPTPEYSLVAQHFDKCITLSSSLRRDKKHLMWTNNVLSILPKLPVHVSISNNENPLPLYPTEMP